MFKRSHLILLFLLSIIFCFAVAFYWPSPRSQSEIEKRQTQEYELGIRHEPITPIPFQLNLDRRKVALGKRLFYDPQLSR